MKKEEKIMKDDLTEREKRMSEMLIGTTVALGCSLIDKAGEEEASKVFSQLMEQRVEGLKTKGMLGKGFQVLADMVSMTAPVFQQEITFDTENMTCRITKCGLWEAGKRMGYGETPLCIRCKANSDTVLNHVLPGYKKTILKSLWKGDDECTMIYRKEKG